ncbi:putative methionine-R-sulfoxide reductase with GAF domain [Actinoplanes tereljensis]|uniref:GAF domain-containing protein n=1 Tax=Paractinoplanes tereljensis TaxID=571912 RepID=A0A919NZR6_9ACTN|nr:GAF and ANTAR domain-containing protein [Actinoplanes tereljensis]GIF26627.1 GAF domain-containing protein [Actinoplanes tereljensis]
MSIDDICRQTRNAVGLSCGVGLTMLNELGNARLVCVDGPFIDYVEQLQISLGQGPLFEAAWTARPVLVDDLAATTVTLRWAAFTVLARRQGAAALFSFPVPVDGFPLAVLDLCRSTPGPLSEPDRAQMTRFAAAAALLISDGAPPADGDFRLQRATGIVMGQIGANAASASRRLRRHASGQNRPLGDVVEDVLAGDLRFDSHG